MKENLQNLQNNKEKQKKHFDCKAKESHYTEGDKIWLYTPVPNQDCPQKYHATGTDYTYEFEVRKIVRCAVQTKRSISQMKDFHLTCKQN